MKSVLADSMFDSSTKTIGWHCRHLSIILFQDQKLLTGLKITLSFGHARRRKVGLWVADNVGQVTRLRIVMTSTLAQESLFPTTFSNQMNLGPWLCVNPASDFVSAGG
jgi:hypothetical protein